MNYKKAAVLTSCFLAFTPSQIPATISFDPPLQGPPGPQGPVGQAPLWQFIGTYDENTVYNEGDVVTYSGGTYRRKAASLGEYGIAPIQNNIGTSWDMVSASPVWQFIGAYSGDTIYNEGDIVTYAGGSYRRKTAYLGQYGIPPTQNNIGEYWDIVSASPVWQFIGAYSGDTIYNEGDIVTYAGGSYRRKNASIGLNDYLQLKSILEKPGIWYLPLHYGSLQAPMTPPPPIMKAISSPMRADLIAEKMLPSA